MIDSERAKVGLALDILSNSLYEFVDVAMVAAHGPQWDERVAEGDAKRRPDGRKHPVSKRDLVVMLKVIQHERISPWWNPNSYAGPRIRSFASEILTLRNLFSHGDHCTGEFVRLQDTASRLLQLLGLPVPSGLVAPKSSSLQSPDDAVAEAPPLPIDLFDEELARLGKPVERLAAMFSRIPELTVEFVGQIIDAGSAEESTGSGLAPDKRAAIGEEAVELLDETYRLEATPEHDSLVQNVLIKLIRCVILDNALLQLAVADYRVSLLTATAAFSADSPERRAALDRNDLVGGWLEPGPIERNRELVQLAQHMDDGSAIAHSIIVLGNFELLNDPTIKEEGVLQLLRDTSASARMLAAMAPGAFYETWVVVLLRREGKLCNDRGRSDEATRAFARAAEIIDRYPAADPDLID